MPSPCIEDVKVSCKNLKSRQQNCVNVKIQTTFIKAIEIISWKLWQKPGIWSNFIKNIWKCGLKPSKIFWNSSLWKSLEFRIPLWGEGTFDLEDKRANSENPLCVYHLHINVLLGRKERRLLWHITHVHVHPLHYRTPPPPPHSLNVNEWKRDFRVEQFHSKRSESMKYSLKKELIIMRSQKLICSHSFHIESGLPLEIMLSCVNLLLKRVEIRYIHSLTFREHPPPHTHTHTHHPGTPWSVHTHTHPPHG